MKRLLCRVGWHSWHTTGWRRGAVMQRCRRCARYSSVHEVVIGRKSSIRRVMEDDR